MATKNSKVNVYDIVTERILSDLNNGIIPWHKPWIVPTVTVKGVKIEIDPKSCAYSRSTGKPYSLLNQMLLGKAGEWATYKQIAEAGGQVKKGEKASVVCFWKFIDEKVVNDKGEEEVKHIPLLRYYNVFHIESQCEGISPKTRPVTDTRMVVESSEEPEAQWDAVEAAEAIVADYLTRTGVKHEEQFGDRAYYTPSYDKIVTPTKGQFKDHEEYYSTLFHEMTHSTGNYKRLNRFTSIDQFSFGSESYSKEELVAELGAASLVNLLGMESKGSFRNSTAYIQNWISALENDHRLIVAASSKAEKAVNYILSGEAE